MELKDDARKWTDNELKRMERKITSIYRTAARDITKKWNAYMENADKRLAPLQEAYDAAKKSGDKALIKETGKKLGQAQRSITFQNEYYQGMLDETTTRLSKVNEMAVAYINGEMPQIYVQNYNYEASDMNKILKDSDIQFNLVREETLKRAVLDELPRKKINVPKDKRWNEKQINSAVTQGIIQGESMNKIAKRLTSIMDNNKNSAIRNARTMVTAAENLGRLDSYKAAEESDVIQTKVWMATGDDRTREAHLYLDGQEVDIDDMFVDINGDELEYPGDPDAPDRTVWNCRCGMRKHTIGYRKKDGSIYYLKGNGKSEFHTSQIEAEKERRLNGG